MGEERKVCKVYVGKLEGKGPLGRPRQRWENGNRMNLGEVGWGWNGFSWLRIGTGEILNSKKIKNVRPNNFVGTRL
jgi:hypothetical protein